MKIYLARHGQSGWQELPTPGANLDSPLTELGHEQARRLALWLAGQREATVDSRVWVSSVAVSPMKRAVESAEYLRSALGIEPILVEGLREAPFHVAEHLPQAETPLSQPVPNSPPASFVEFQRQVQGAFEEIVALAEAADGPLLTISHGGVIKSMLRWIAGSDRLDFRLGNTSLHLIHWRRRRWHLEWLNLWDHLPLELRTY